MSDAAVTTGHLDTVTVTGSHPAAHSHFWAGNGFSFHDVLDAINPLQHLPIIGTIYRAITHDTIGNVARIVGDGLYGGILGAVSGAVDVALVETTGKDLGQNLLSIVEGDEKDGKGKEAVPSGANPSDAAPGAASPTGKGAPQAGAAIASQSSGGGTRAQRPAGTLDPNVPVDVPYFPASASPAMPSFGSPETASALAAAAPATQLDVAAALKNSGSPQGVAGAAAAGAGVGATATDGFDISGSTGERSGSAEAATSVASPSDTGPANGVKPLGSGSNFIPIDTTPAGIMRMKAMGASKNNQAVPLDLPPGTQLTTQQPSAPTTSVDFAAKMREGLDKYNAMLAQRAKEARQSSVDTTS